MLPAWVLLVSLGYAALLFAVAWAGDRYPLYPQRPWLRPAVYSLALAVYCSSWTFYGAVGSAVRYGIGYLPIYLGPFLMMMFGWRIMERLALIARSQNTVSIADFIASRYGRSQRLAALVALIALLAAVPYQALQYKAVALSLDVLTGPTRSNSLLGDPALYVAILMAVFSVMFGTRQVDATEHRPGLILAVAFESLVKLIALITIGVFSILWFSGSGTSLVQATRTLLDTPPIGFVGQTLLAFAAMVCLPRQFHVAIVECGDVADIRRARWWFGGYLVIVCLMVLPIASAGATLFGFSNTAPDSFVLALPLAENNAALALVAYIGGFSAATGMVIVASVALSTMISNDLIMPILLRRRRAGSLDRNVASTVLWIRRVAIFFMASLAYGYYRASGSDTALASFGLMAFAAVAQFGPGLIGGLYWSGTSRRGVEAGLLIGFGIWTYTLLLPSLTESGWLNPAWMLEGLFGLHWLRPHHLFGSTGWDPLTHGTFWSLLLNGLTMLLVSMRWPPGLAERLRAEPFLNPYAEHRAQAPGQWRGNLQVADLQALASRIIGEPAAQKAFEEQARQRGLTLTPGMAADATWIHATELLLAAAVGAASARLLMTTALEGTGMEITAIVSILDEAAPALRFNREILLATLENIDQGVSVVDAEMRLVAWNQRYLQLFGYPADMLYVGRPVADLIRFNVENGKLGPASRLDIEQEIDKRIAFMRAGSPHIFQRVLDSGQVLELRGRPLPAGGYVTTYSDISAYKHVEGELREMNENLEQRVAERTREAEQAQESRTRFLTAVSHDVLQPINAARLFASALRASEQAAEQKHLAERVDTSLRAAEELLDGLLDVSRLDAGALRPDVTLFDAGILMRQLVEQYAPMAQGRGLELRLHARSHYVRSDQRLLRRVLQNFLANALRYTRQGRILLTARQRGDSVVFQVWDTGPGIPAHHLRQIYEEFHRYEQPFDWDGRGLGLGLSICQRISLLLGHALDARSIVGRGSMFSIAVPRVAAPAPSASLSVRAAAPGAEASNVAGLKVLCVDNDPDILEGMRALLQRWQIEIHCATTVDEALAAMEQNPDVLLVDYHLHDRLDGLDTLDALRQLKAGVRGALLTADGSDTLKQLARARGYHVLTKPVKPASLRAYLAAQHKAGRSGTVAR